MFKFCSFWDVQSEVCVSKLGFLYNGGVCDSGSDNGSDGMTLFTLLVLLLLRAECCCSKVFSTYDHVC